MNNNEKKCTICGGSMEKGFILDMTGSVTQSASRWVKGDPEQTILGLTAFSDRPNFHLSAYRCSNCGQIMLFGIDPPWESRQ